MDTLLKVADVAAYLRVSESTVKSLARSGELPSFKLGRQHRFSLAAIEAWISAQHPGLAVQQQAPRLEPIAVPSDFVPVDFAAVLTAEGRQRLRR